MILIRILIFFLGLMLVARTMLSAIRSYVLPRSAPDRISRFVFVTLRRIFSFRVRWARTFAERDRILAFYAPVSLLMLLPTWLTLILLGYMGMFWATGVDSWHDAFTLSGSSLFTLGFAREDALYHIILTFTESTIGLILVALLLAYLPTMYSAFSQREHAVALLEVRAGSPPSALEMLLRFKQLHSLDELHDLWAEWEAWFAELKESHTSLSALVFFRSPQPEHSWVTASGAVLDAAALHLAAVDVPVDTQAELCIRAGTVTLRRISDFFGIKYDPDPHFPDQPITVTREEFDAAYDRLGEHGIPLRTDREQAWRDFAGWRVNYDAVLIGLCSLTMAPEAPWSSDRAPMIDLPFWAERKR